MKSFEMRGKCRREQKKTLCLNWELYDNNRREKERARDRERKKKKRITESLHISSSIVITPLSLPFNYPDIKIDILFFSSFYNRSNELISTVISYNWIHIFLLARS